MEMTDSRMLSVISVLISAFPFVGEVLGVCLRRRRFLGRARPRVRLRPLGGRLLRAEAGLRLKNMVVADKMPDLIPFVRYEYYNPQQKVVVSKNNLKTADQRLKTSMWVAGVNYRPLPYLVVKADYTKRRIGDGNYKAENEFALGVAFTGWFVNDNKFARLKKQKNNNR